MFPLSKTSTTIAVPNGGRRTGWRVSGGLCYTLPVSRELTGKRARRKTRKPERKSKINKHLEESCRQETTDSVNDTEHPAPSAPWAQRNIGYEMRPHRRRSTSTSGMQPGRTQLINRLISTWFCVPSPPRQSWPSFPTARMATMKRDGSTIASSSFSRGDSQLYLRQWWPEHKPF